MAITTSEKKLVTWQCLNTSSDIPYSWAFKTLHFPETVLLVSFYFKGAIVFTKMIFKRTFIEY